MSAHRALVILQARAGSQRLPGKVLASLLHWPLVEYCIRRLVAADVGQVVLATTTHVEDRPILALAASLGVAVHAGPDDDVLGRFAQVAERFPDAGHVIRATADNPFVDLGTCARVLKVLDAGADYAVEEALPYGTAVEGLRRDVLLRAHREATTAHDREHVTPWVRRHDHLVRMSPTAPEDVRAPELRFTVDTPDDLAYARRLAADLHVEGHDPRLATLPQVIAAARRVPVAGGA